MNDVTLTEWLMANTVLLILAYVTLLVIDYYLDINIIPIPFY